MFWQSLKIEILEFLHHPGYLISTFIFPGLFFVVFAAPNIEDKQSALQYATSFMAFGLLGVVFFQYTIAVIEQKSSGWESLRRTLPIPHLTRIFVKLVLFAAFGFITGGVVYLLAYLTTPLEIGFVHLLLVLSAALILSIPFFFFGGWIAYKLNPLSALPVMNMVYLLLSFSGGLWLPPDALPSWLAEISIGLPTRQYAEILWSISKSEIPGIKPILYLIMMSLVFGILLTRAIRKFESENYT